MLPDFPVLKRRISDMLTNYLRERIRGEPLMKQVGRIVQHEGHDWKMKTFDGHTDTAGFEKHTSKVTIARDQVIAEGPLAFQKHIDDVATDMIGQQHRMMFRKLDAVTQKTGNVVSGDGKPFTFELYLEGLEKIDIDFDDEGHPFMPTMVLHPATWEKIKDNVRAWDNDPVYRRQFDELIEKKRSQWRDRESRRKLVD